jgi:hypothetical protein
MAFFIIQLPRTSKTLSLRLFSGDEHVLEDPIATTVGCDSDGLAHTQALVDHVRDDVV